MAVARQEEAQPGCCIALGNDQGACLFSETRGTPRQWEAGAEGRG